tara:strand:+ start:240 stop:740 length:501 start_codon:yes stop_codon:yes gene_type:complete
MIIGCSTEPEDCAGVTNGDSELDICGTCDDNPNNDCQDCSTYFTFNQSILQAPYFFEKVLIDLEPVDANDLVGIFKGDVCVGIKQWDTSQCGQHICSINAMGDDGSDLTEGYLLPGEIPTFIIYDVSDSIIYNATTIDTISPWFPTVFFNFSTLVADTTSASPCQR